MNISDYGINKSTKDKIYCYPDTDVLKNKLNIKDFEVLSIAERKITSLNEFAIRDKPIQGNFDYKHLQDIHKNIFGDIYSWAGKLRTVDIGKGNSFCYAANLLSYGNDIFERLKRDKYLIGMSKEQVISKLAEYLGDINALHPFREGNGRTQRQFIGYLAKATGIELRFDKANSDEMLEASKKSFMCDYSLYCKILNEIAEPMTLDEQRNFLKLTSKTAHKLFEDMFNSNALKDRTMEFENIVVVSNDRQAKNYQTIDDWKNDIANARSTNKTGDNENNTQKNKELKTSEKE